MERYNYMNTLQFSIFINAPKEKVWNTMLDDATYRQWTKPFNETSYYKGDWSEGSKILFLGTDKNGEKEGGMYSRIAKNIPFEYVSIQHLGMVENGVETPWQGEGDGFENYTLVEKDGGTEVMIEMVNIPDDFCPSMNEMWPKALEVLKVLAEK
jgi:uncharacterized protein YndB with AHSA1/START domain